jgi:hypothetical protein
MPSLSDIFNPSFFMCLGILVLLTALIVVYFESKMREQNHKIASMLSLVSSLAEEQNNLRMEVFRMVTTGQTNSGNSFPVNTFPVNNLPVNNFPVNSFINKNENSDLINVSDDEDDSDDEYDSDDDDSDDDNNSNDSEDDSEDDLEENDIKVLKININNKESNNDDNDFNIEEIDNLEELGENTDDDNDIDIDDDDSIINEIDESVSSEDDLKEETIVPTNLNNLEESETPKIDLNAIDFKQISISGLENDLNDNETMDYKKLSLNKLKSLVVEKGLTKDSSKLKKNELLNLLGVK